MSLSFAGDLPAFVEFDENGKAVFEAHGKRTAYDVCLPPTPENAERLRALGGVFLFSIHGKAAVCKGMEWVGFGCDPEEIVQGARDDLERERERKRKLDLELLAPRV